MGRRRRRNGKNGFEPDHAESATMGATAGDGWTLSKSARRRAQRQRAGVVPPVQAQQPPLAHQTRSPGPPAQAGMHPDTSTSSGGKSKRLRNRKNRKNRNQKIEPEDAQLSGCPASSPAASTSVPASARPASTSSSLASSLSANIGSRVAATACGKKKSIGATARLRERLRVWAGEEARSGRWLAVLSVFLAALVCVLVVRGSAQSGTLSEFAYSSTIASNLTTFSQYSGDRLYALGRAVNDAARSVADAVSEIGVCCL
jgi:hypothetical protein